MSFRVVIQPNAKANLRDYYRRAAKHAPLTAARWLERFEAAIESLKEMPERYSLAPEGKFVECKLRQMLFGKRPNVFRVLFRISGDEVQVLHIRRAAMDLATLDELLGTNESEE